jgi:hypothetical protein
VAKTITDKELATLAQSGATIVRSPREVFSPELNDALNKVSQVISDKRSTEVVNAISSLTKAVENSKASPLQLGPVIDTLSRLVDATNNKPVYRFNITRNSRGQMIAVTATPENNIK